MTKIKFGACVSVCVGGGGEGGGGEGAGGAGGGGRGRVAVYGQHMTIKSSSVSFNDFNWLTLIYQVLDTSKGI